MACEKQCAEERREFKLFGYLVEQEYVCKMNDDIESMIRGGILTVEGVLNGV